MVTARKGTKRVGERAREEKRGREVHSVAVIITSDVVVVLH
jgi:hypothetical protein